MAIILIPVATVRNSRLVPADDFWGDIISEIELADHIPTEAFDGISEFSHLEIIYYFDKVDPRTSFSLGIQEGIPIIQTLVFSACVKKDRPNSIGLCTVELLEHCGRTIKVKNLDAINGTPVLDIKPVFQEFQPEGEIKQPEWVANLMKDYWKQS